jgi:hypothetical protein
MDFGCDSVGIKALSYAFVDNWSLLCRLWKNKLEVLDGQVIALKDSIIV